VSGDVIEQAAEIGPNGIRSGSRAGRGWLHDHQRFDVDAAAAVVAAAKHFVAVRRPAGDG
jgi:hypothetical protein